MPILDVLCPGILHTTRIPGPPKGLPGSPNRCHPVLQPLRAQSECLRHSPGGRNDAKCPKLNGIASSNFGAVAADRAEPWGILHDPTSSIELCNGLKEEVMHSRTP